MKTNKSNIKTGKIRKSNIIALGFIIFLFPTLGYGQSVGCKVTRAFCNDKFAGPQPNCFAKKVDCQNPNDSNKSIIGYVPSSARVNYIEVDVIAPNGNTQTAKIPMRGTVENVNNDVIHQTDVIMYLMQNGYMKSGSRLSLVGVGIAKDTKFGKKSKDIIQVSGPPLYQDWQIVSSASTLDQALKSGGEKSSTWDCNYTTQPIVIDVPCDKSCGANVRCPISHNKKQFCVGSAKCKTKTGYFTIHHVFCQASSCPTKVIDCIVDPSVHTYKQENVVPHWTGNNVQRSLGGDGNATQ